MPEQVTCSIAVVCEADADRRAATLLSDAEQLTASEKGARRDAKRVLDALTGGDPDREDACLDEPSLALLRQRGANTGLAPYLQEIEERLVPLFDPSAKPTAHHHAR